MLQFQREPLIQIHQLAMAGVESAKRALRALLKNFDARRTAKLTVTTEKGKLVVNLEESFNQHSNVTAGSKTLVKRSRRVTPSRLRRRERRAADPAVRQRAAEHAAKAESEDSNVSEASAQVETSPEKERSSSLEVSLEVTPSKEEVREEVVEEEVEKPFLDQRFKIKLSLPDFEEIQRIEGIMGETNHCCLCEFQCSVPSEQEENGRRCGMLGALWEHLETHHPAEYDGWFA